MASAAAIIGDNIGYLLGRVGGYRLMRRYGHYVRVDEAKMKVGRYLFDCHGGKVVFFGRFVSVRRTYAAFLAGTNRMPWSNFLVYTWPVKHPPGHALRLRRDTSLACHP